MRKILNAAALAVLTASCLNAAISQPVKVTGGLVSGVPGKDPSILTFKGIPFAAPPVGDLRWREPQPVSEWPGVRQADHFSPACIQTIVEEFKPWTHEFMTHGEVSEDCLYLNVWTAAKSSADKRPVFVYIYGGGFTAGSGAVPVYDGEGLARKGLVVVTFNYRLGVLGFLAYPELSRESGHQASGNYGLFDQIAALRWIQANIERFGGDPSRVTIAGQSAGGMSVHDLTASPLAKGLFQRAIVESGGSTLIPIEPRVLAAAEADGEKFAESKGAKSLADLRALSWQKLMEPTPGGSGIPGLRFAPIVDGYLLPATVAKIFAEGKENDVVTLTGANTEELAGLLGPPQHLTAEAFGKQIKQKYGERAGEFLRLYPAASDEQAVIAQSESTRDLTLLEMYLWARARSKTARTSVYEYLWDHTLPGPDAARFGAFHTSEVPYVLNTLDMSDRPFTDADREIADMMSSYWANFAAHGDPNGEGVPHWPAIDERAEIMEVGDRTGPIPLAGSPAKLAFFESVLMK